MYDHLALVGKGTTASGAGARIGGGRCAAKAGSRREDLDLLEF